MSACRMFSFDSFALGVLPSSEIDKCLVAVDMGLASLGIGESLLCKLKIMRYRYSDSSGEFGEPAKLWGERIKLESFGFT